MHVYPFVENEKFGVKDDSGKLILEARYDYISGFHKFVGPDSPSAIIGCNGLYGIVNYKGEIIVPIEYEEINHKGESVWTSRYNRMMRQKGRNILYDYLPSFFLRKHNSLYVFDAIRLEYIGEAFYFKPINSNLVNMEDLFKDIESYSLIKE